METAVCYDCVEDEHLKEIILNDGEPIECSVCHGVDNNAITVGQLGKLMEPILREHFSLGQEYKKFGEDDDNDWWEQEGESLSSVVQEVLGQYFDFEDEIVDAVIDAEDVWPPDGEEPFFDNTSSYVESRIRLSHYYAQWDYLLDELKHTRRFFSPTAQELFGQLFDNVEALKYWDSEKNEWGSVILELPEITSLYRARPCTSRQDLTDMFINPLKHVGPPPKHLARAGRMNAEGVVVFYGAMNMDTCLAEMRPVLGGDTAVITLQTTKPLRLLDFKRLESARGKSLSYFQPDFTLQVEKNAFLRRLHGLISQPIIPTRESDYLITQTMAEYLAHVIHPSFDGVMFASVQKAGGTNIVLFPDAAVLVGDAFPLEYIDGSIKMFSTHSIEYSHKERSVGIYRGGSAYLPRL